MFSFFEVLVKIKLGHLILITCTLGQATKLLHSLLEEEETSTDYDTDDSDNDDEHILLF